MKCFGSISSAIRAPCPSCQHDTRHTDISSPHLHRKLEHLPIGAWDLGGDLAVEQPAAALATVACTSWAARIIRARRGGPTRMRCDLDVPLAAA